jgi:hypothetical protein
MRKAMLVLALLSFSSFGFHNFVIAPDSARIGIDTLTCTGSYEHVGDTLTVAQFFQDLNHNGVYDAGTDVDQLHGGSSQIIDGNKTAGGENGPSDTVLDGLLNLKLTTEKSPFNTPGYFVFIFTSGGISDTAGFKLLVTKTATFISGTATGPGSLAAKNIQIRLEFSDAVTHNGFAEMNMLTDTSGAYITYLDSTYRGKRVKVQYSSDGGVTVPSTWIIPSPIDTLLTDSLKNINLVFTGASHFIKGTLVDEHGAAVKNAQCYLQDSTSNPNNFKADSLGKFLLGVPTGNYGIYLQWWNFPGYLANNTSNRLTVTSATDTVHFTWVLHTADTVISGTVTDDSLTLNKSNLPIQMTGKVMDSSFQTGVAMTSAGSYRVRVTSFIDTYSVQAINNNLPGKFYIYPVSYPAVHFGATNCNFAIKKGAAAISGTVHDTLGHVVDNCQVLISDTAQKIYFSFQTGGNGGNNFKQIVPSGTYMIGFSGYSQQISMYVSGTEGPITIASSGKDTSVNCVARVTATGLTRSGTGFGLAPFSFSRLHSPASASQAFAFSTPVAGTARLVLFDLEGRTVATLLNRNVTAGSYRVNWSMESGLLAANAAYIAKFDFRGARTYGAVKKFMLMR